MEMRLGPQPEISTPDLDQLEMLPEIQHENPVQVSIVRVRSARHFLATCYKTSETDHRQLYEQDVWAMAVALPDMFSEQSDRFDPRTQGQLPIHISRLERQLQGMTADQIAAQDGITGSGVYSSRSDFMKGVIEAFPDINEVAQLCKESVGTTVELLNDRPNNEINKPRIVQPTFMPAPQPLDLKKIQKRGEGDEKSSAKSLAIYVRQENLTNLSSLNESAALCRLFLRATRYAKNLKKEELDALERIHLLQQDPLNKNDKNRADRAIVKLYQQIAKYGYPVPEKYQK